MSFVDAWQDRIWPVIGQDFAALSQERPCKQEEGAVGQHYGGKKISDFLKQSGEARNVTCNLTWMKVLQMAPTNQNLSYAMVEKAAQTLWHQDGQPRLPQLWPRALNIPIACLTTDEPVKGEMTRYGCCLAVCSFWLTYYQAKTGGNAALLQQMKTLAVNVPFDFKLFANQDEVLNAAAEGLEANEMLRELFGLSGIVLINLVMEVRDMLGRRTSGKKDATAIAEHLATLRWYDMKRCPKKDTCESYLHIGGMLRRASRAQVAIEIAAVKYGRDTIFDEPSKLLLFVQKSLNIQDFEFMMEGLLVNMIRTGNADRQSVAELKSKAGDPAFWLFIRRYFHHLERQYPMPALPATGSNPTPPATGGNPPPPAASSGQQPPPPALPATGSNPATAPALTGQERVQRILGSPLVWWEECMGPAQGLAWTAGLAEPLALRFAHARAIFEGRFNEPLRGLLGSPPLGGAKPADFLKIERVKTVFLDPFEKAWQDFTGKAIEGAPPGTGGAAGTQQPGTGSLPQGPPPAPGSSKPDASTVREDARRHADEFLAQHLMVVPKSASGPEMLVALHGNASWVGLTETRRFSGVYDPKNARLAKIYAKAGEKKSRQNWWQRVPALNVADFQMWGKTMDSLMTPGTDMVWVFSGKLRSQERLLEAEMAKFKWDWKALTLVYDPRTMRNMYWVRERGMANAGMSEVLFCCWKGAVPKFPSNRGHVDAGSPTYYDVMARVPVASEAELLFGTPADRDRLLAILGTDAADAPADTVGDDEEAETAADEEAERKRRYAKRHSGRALVRLPSSERVPLFPLDNSPRLLQEIAHESGAEPRVFLHGTPGGGAGIYGLLAQRAFVVALVHDTEHGDKMRAALMDRITDSALTPGGAFSTAELSRQVQELGQGAVKAKKKPVVVSDAESGSAAETGSDSESDSERPPKIPKTAEGSKNQNKKEDKKEKKEPKPTPKKDTKKDDKKEKKDPKPTPKKDNKKDAKKDNKKDAKTAK